MTCDEKLRYKSRKEARAVMKSVYKKRHTTLRAYQCDICHDWHLTKQLIRKL